MTQMVSQITQIYPRYLRYSVCVICGKPSFFLCKISTMIKQLLAIISFFLLPLFIACNEKEEVMCTIEFRTVAITVNGTDLDQYYTIRESTGDTIRIDRGNLPGNKTYPVLDDNFQQTIKNTTENFRFRGFINGTIVVNELFVIKADDCHIEYVSGKTVIP